MDKSFNTPPKSDHALNLTCYTTGDDIFRIQHSVVGLPNGNRDGLQIYASIDGSSGLIYLDNASARELFVWLAGWMHGLHRP